MDIVKFFLMTLHIFLRNGSFSKEFYTSIEGRDIESCGSFVTPCKGIEYIIQNLVADNDTLLLDSSSTHTIEYIVTSNIDVQNSFTIKKANDSHRDPVIKVMQGSAPVHTLFKWNTTKQVHVTLRNIKFINSRIVHHFKGKLSISIIQCSVVDAGWNVAIHSTTGTQNTSHMKVEVTDSYISLRSGLFFFGQQNVPAYLSIRNSVLIGGRIRHHQAPNQWKSSDIIVLRNVTFEKIEGSVVELYNPPNVMMTDVIFRNMGGEDNAFTVHNSHTRNDSKSNVTMHNVTFQNINAKYRVLIDIKQCAMSINGLTIKENKNITGISASNARLSVDNFTSKDNSYTHQYLWSSESVLNIGKMVHNNVTSRYEGLEIKESIVTIKELVFKNLYMHHRSLLILDTEININKVIFTNNFVKRESIRLHGGKMNINSLLMSDNHLKGQGIFVTKGDCSILNGYIYNNTGFTTLIGAYKMNKNVVISFKLSSVIFSENNLTKGNIIHFDRLSRTNLQNISIIDNVFTSGIQILKSHTVVNGVFMRGNKAKGRWKALRYDDGNENLDVSICNVDVVFSQHELYKKDDTILEVQIKESNLKISKVKIETEKMKLPAMSITKFVIGTKNQNVRPDIQITCSTNYNPIAKDIITETKMTHEVFCEPCRRGKYSIRRGNITTWRINNEWIDFANWKRNNSHLKIFQTNEDIHKCHDCPSGGNCNNLIKSHGNFYGYKFNDNLIKFIPCPSGYCCSQQSQTCIGISTCNYHRTGRLCGKCIDSYYENYLSATCTPNTECTKSKQDNFWVIFSFTAMVYAFVLCFLKDFVTFLRFIAVRLQTIMQQLKLITSSENISSSTVAHTPYIGDDKDDVFKESSKKQEEKIVHYGVFKDSEGRSSVFRNECINSANDPRKFTVGAVIQIIISFYQIRTMITTDIMAESSVSYMSNFFSRLSNLELFIKIGESICPIQRNDALTKILIKNILFTVLILLILIVCLMLSYIISRFFSHFEVRAKEFKLRSSLELFKELTKLPLYQKVMVSYLKVLIIGYKNFSFFAVTLTNCVTVNNVRYLFISGNTKCYQNWQYWNFAFLFLWVLPFPFALTCLYYLLKKRAINSWVFVICLTFPVLTLILIILRKTKIQFALAGSDHEQELRAVLYETFEEPYQSTKRYTIFWWQTWILYERLLLVSITTYVINPIIEMTVVTPVIVVLLWLHIYMKPYRKTMSVLTWLDITSYICLCVQVVNSSFQSVMYTFDIPLQFPMDVTLNAFEYFEIIFSPFVVLLLYFIGLIFSKVCKWLMAVF